MNIAAGHLLTYSRLSLSFVAEQKTSIKDYLLFAEAFLSLARARIMLLFRPFNKILPVLKDDAVPTTQPDIALLELIQISIARAAAKSPWRTECFEQALAARMMLKKRGIATTTYFGVLKNNDKIEAHAWLKCGDFVVTGWKKIEFYTVLSSY